ncbi:uncharacterized conserved protein [Candidatus Brocadia sinica JPN1]|uniref:Uncharacterized conserved protein n=1 Tax=Candidatus Brocadia sinica JPN1 TaxID=1197129 RepID=A0ABQ0K411_9BACT|nr:uncharacterized conserved protein [Candidatus Brocadia sinica JPN1]
MQHQGGNARTLQRGLGKAQLPPLVLIPGEGRLLSMEKIFRRK